MPIISEYGTPYDPGTPEEAEYLHGQARGAGLVASQFLPAWATMLVPWGKDAAGKEGLSLPGVVSGAYGGLGTLAPTGINLLTRKLGYGTNLGPAPGAEAANEMFQNNARWAQDTVPQPMRPENESEQRVADIAFGGATMALPIPGAAMAAIPRAARIATSLAVPHGAVGGLLGAGVTAGIGAYEDHARDNLIRELGGDPDEIKGVREGHDLTQPDTTQQVAHPEVGAPATVPFRTASVTTPTVTTDVAPTEGKYDTLAAFGRPDIKVMTPQFDTTGETGTTMGEAIGAGMVGLIAAPLLMRYGGRVLDPAIKLMTGHGDQINTAARAAKFNANLDAIDSGQKIIQDPNAKPGAVRGEAPLPGKAGTVMTNVAQAAYDKTRVLTELGNAIAPDSGAAKQMEARIGTINHSTPLMNAIAEQMATGVNKANGGKTLPKWKSIVQDIDNLSPDQANKLDKGLYAGDELDTRSMKFNAARQTGVMPDDAATRHNFRSAHSDDLRQAHQDMLADPELAPIAQRIYAMQKAHMVHARDMGRLTDVDMNRIIKQRPNQIPSTNLEGVVEHGLSTRDTSVVGWDTPPTRAVDALTQHYAKLYEELSKNRLDDDLIKAAEVWQKADPSRPRIVNEIFDAQGKPVPTAEGRTHTVFRDGTAHTYNIDNSNLHRAFKGNVIQTRMLLNTADSLRRSYQSGTTGVSGMVIAQRPFPFINLNRNIPQIATDRTPGTVFGVIDRMMQQGTGGKIGYRGPDPSQWIGSYYHSIKGSGAATARAMSDALRRPGNPVTKGLSAYKGEAWVKGWADKLEQRYLSSDTAQRRAEGASGVTASGQYDRPTYNIARSNRVGYSPLADTVPGVFHPDGLAIPYTHIRIPATKGVTTSYINVRTWLRDVHQEISEGANAYYWKQNPQLSPERRTFETRRVVGDPSMHGASATAQRATHLIPWINPSVQDAVRMMRNLRDNPVAFTLGTVHSLGIAATSSILSAMLGGNKHLNMLGKLMSTHDRAANVAFFHDPDNENNYTQISLPQRWRMLYPLILEGVAEGLGSFTMHQDDDMYHRVVHALSDLFNHHITHSTVTAAREGLQDFVGVAQPPPALQLAAAVSGGRINEPVSQVIENVAEHRGPFENMYQKTDKPGRLPGQAANSAYVSNDDANWVHQVLKSVLGIAGDGYMHVSNFTQRLNLTHDIADAFSGLLTDAGQSWRDNAPFGNMVWGNNVKQTVRNPIEEMNRVAWEHMQSMPSRADMAPPGLTRQGGLPISVTGQAKVSDDPIIRQMVTTINNYTSRIGSGIEPKISDLRKVIADVNNTAYYAAGDKRTILNDLVTKKNALESQKNLAIEQMHSELSRLTGGKHVNVVTFDPKQGMEQFHD